MTSTLEEFVRHQRCRQGPAWRSRWVGGTPSLLDGEDETLRNFAAYRRLVETSGAQCAITAMPTFAAAEALNDAGERTSALMLMTLAEMDYDAMQRRTGIDVEILKLWEALYFDARGQRQAIGWLAQHVIEPARQNGRFQFAAQLCFASMAGETAVCAMLDAESGTYLDEAERLFQRGLTLSTKLDAVAAMTLGSERAGLRFAKLHVELMVAGRRWKHDREKLRQRSIEAQQRYELQKLRLELKLAQATEKVTEKREGSLRRAEAHPHREAAPRAGSPVEQTLAETPQSGVDRAEQSALANLRRRTHVEEAVDMQADPEDPGPTILSVVRPPPPADDLVSTTPLRAAAV